ncbi:hypothetical protein pEaSNUABM37_00248 [Erwinia phage pEa_SNUABM_37]|nr:hypothetical protein pEaSNUABM37_00248 [Erwinia phage pEa_SNUABM_37]QXO10716.1 hypothetical protein pEaSNUABM48_00248 [Erwinia phage pEa_SNUABM_48]
MRVVIHDFGPISDTLTGELVHMDDACVAYEDIVDLITVNRVPDTEGYEDYLIDVLCDERDLNIHDRQLVRSAYYRIRPIMEQILPASFGYWLCCGFVGKQGYFIISAQYNQYAMQEMREMVFNSIRSLWGFYDSSLKQRSGLY